MDETTRTRLIQQHLEAIRDLQAPPSAAGTADWPPAGFYWLFHVLAGMILGFIGATVSLLVNIVGALLVGEPPLKLIQVYLTFPMGQRALDLPPGQGGMILFVGCVLYLVTGSLYGIVFHLVMTWFFADASFVKRFLIGSALGLALWLVNFYLVLSWLQPVLLGDNWIVRLVPVWVGAGTHLVFAWTMVLVADWGRFIPFRNR